MSRRNRDEWDRMFEDEYADRSGAEEWREKGSRFLRYLATRKMECWGLFAAGFLIATIL